MLDKLDIYLGMRWYTRFAEEAAADVKSTLLNQWNSMAVVSALIISLCLTALGFYDKLTMFSGGPAPTRGHYAFQWLWAFAVLTAFLSLANGIILQWSLSLVKSGDVKKWCVTYKALMVGPGTWLILSIVLALTAVAVTLYGMFGKGIGIAMVTIYALCTLSYLAVLLFVITPEPK
jgi:hypothetical protein